LAPSAGFAAAGLGAAVLAEAGAVVLLVAGAAAVLVAAGAGAAGAVVAAGAGVGAAVLLAGPLWLHAASRATSEAAIKMRVNFIVVLS